LNNRTDIEIGLLSLVLLSVWIYLIFSNKILLQQFTLCAAATFFISIWF